AAGGATYNLTKTLAPAGASYTYSFEASDGLDLATLPATPVSLRVDPGPELLFMGSAGYESDGASPDLSAPGQEVVFQVKYRHAGGVRPTQLRLVVDGIPTVLPNPASGDYAAGVVYEHKTSLLAPGTHAYFFEAETAAASFRLPSASSPQALVVASSATLPTALYGHAAVWIGGSAYLFGGVRPDATSAQILRYTPSTGQVSDTGKALPAPTRYASAVTDGRYAYVFGGSPSASTLHSTIVRYDPQANTVTTLGARLPVGLDLSSAVWTGTGALVFGGRTGGGPTDTILHYDPARDVLTTLPARLPAVRSQSSAIWDGQAAYIFGGFGTSRLDTIVRYDPQSGTATTLPSRLPSARGYTAAFWDGSRAYVLGGLSSSGAAMAEVVRFDPLLGGVQALSARLPVGTAFAGVAWDGSANAHLLGGWRDILPHSNGILRLMPAQLGVRVNHPPSLSYTGDSGYASDGAHPDRIGSSGGSITFRVRYTDPDGQAPTSVRVVVDGTAFTMAAVPGSLDYASGVVHEKALVLAPGLHTYHFEAVDGPTVLRLPADPGATVSVLPDKLPSAIHAAASVRIGDSIYLFGGGASSATDKILRLNLTSGAVTTQAARLPATTRYASAATDGRYAYVFGGLASSSTYRSDITRYDPVLDVAVRITANPPLPAIAYTGAVWSGQSAYLFGGATPGGAPADTILRFDASSSPPSVTALAEKLPAKLLRIGTAWDGRFAYLFGGSTTDPARPSDGVLRFDSVTQKVTALPTKLPTPRAFASAFWDGARAYIVGGQAVDGNGTSFALPDVLSFDPATNAMVRLPAQLSSPLAVGSLE
ncbi:MAG TPA: kelch repeat-containing protein, partial [Candidatus Thermoplasmatota archaeon]|nr:kelch repeat-containing protein [Candidatus Thermoplasmatota archaeon]